MDTISQDNSDSVEPRFADNFLHDRNIKWILASGAAILLGSSLMLVSSQWDGYSVLFKEIILLVYTYGVFAAGRYGYQRLALRRTGTMLLALALMLAPVSCAALPWMWDVESVSWNAAYVALLIAAGGLTTVIGAKTFRHFLRESQPMLTATYVLLALAGAVVPESNLEGSPWVATLLWGIFAVGTIKVNHRVFWLVEEQRQPRIVGFFPTALLGALYLGLFARCFAANTNVDWIGFGCVLTAIPLLAAADAVARVFQQRTGDLVRPLPWSILAPLGGGLLLCAIGVLLAASNLAHGAPYALVPSAALAAVLLGLVARRTGRQEFVYAALVLSVVAYRFLPVFFAEAVRIFVQSTATAIREPTLPWAFYGFTFLPLLLIFTLVAESARRRGSLLFAEPLKCFAIGLAAAFLGLSVTHEKAMLPAAATLCLVFATQTIVFRNRLLALPAIVALGIAALGLPAFYNGVLAVRYPTLLPQRLPATFGFTCEVAVAMLLTLPAVAIDRFLARFPMTCFGRPLSSEVQEVLQAPCRQAGLLLTIGLSALWLFDYFLGTGMTARLPIAGVLVVTALLQAFLQRHVTIGISSVLFANVVAAILLVENSSGDVQYATLQTLVLLAQWIGSYLLALRPESRLGQVFGPALHHCSLVLLSLAFVGVILPLHAAETATGGFLFSPHGRLWFPTLLLLVWSFDAARREHHAFFGYAALVGLYVLASSATRTFVADSLEWLPLVWTAVSAALVPFERLLRRDEEAPSAFRVPLRKIVPNVLLSVSVGSWFGLTLPFFVVGSAAPLVFAAWLAMRRSPLRVQLPLILLNWRLLGFVAALASPELRHFGELTFANVADFSLPVALTAALNLLTWSTFARRVRWERTSAIDVDLIAPQQYGMRLVACYLTLASLALPTLDAASALSAVGVFIVMIVVELHAACLDRDERRVWLAEMLAAVAVGYFAWFRVIEFGRGFAMFLVLGVGLAMWLVGRLVERRPGLAVLARPFQMTGRCLPLATVALGVYRHVWHFEMHGTHARWLGWNSLALLLSAAFYFWQGLTTRDKRFTVLSAGILNTAVALLWRELHLSDPQFYLIPLGITVLWLVELLEREIPESYRDPLRYVGALVILVSPTFHIVDGLWLHIFSLMVVAAGVILAGIGLRVRAMLYTGTAFLLADLVAMVVRGTIDHPELLWVAGLALGASVLAVGAAAEMRRERILQRVRAVTASLETWK